MAWLWIGFIAFVVVMLAIDLFLINRKAHVIRPKEAMAWTCVCVVMALLFSGVVYHVYTHDVLGIGSRYAQHLAAETAGAGARGVAEPAGGSVVWTGEKLGRRAWSEFLAGWLIEYSLSLDNIFVIAMIFLHFRVKPQFQHRVLFWGILGALALRGVMILGGAMLIEKFHWIMYVFAVVLLYTAVKMLRGGAEHFDPEQSPILKFSRRVFRVSAPREDERFLVREGGKLAVTPLFIVLLMVETTDVIFAVDSIPAIFAVTRDPFLVFTSNVFAILGLRSLYFALASLMDSFAHLKYSLAFVLAFVGVKMLLGMWGIHMSSGLSLGVIVVALVAGVASSIFFAKRGEAGEAAPGHLGQAPGPETHGAPGGGRESDESVVVGGAEGRGSAS
jgi:tellurite resistance protein TerC